MAIRSPSGHLEVEIAYSIRAYRAVLDSELGCLDDDGRPNFHELLFCREWPYFYSFDIIASEGEDLRGERLLQRKKIPKSIMANVESRLRYVDHVEERGVDLFAEICPRDL